MKAFYCLLSTTCLRSHETKIGQHKQVQVIIEIKNSFINVNVNVNTHVVW